MWSDTDPAGIVWFGVFFRYFEHAEEELYRCLGSDRTALLRRLNIFMPRTSLQTQFRSPARLGDEIAVGVGVSEMRERRIGFAFDIHERGTRRLICEASYRVACVAAHLRIGAREHRLHTLFTKHLSGALTSVPVNAFRTN